MSGSNEAFCTRAARRADLPEILDVQHRAFSRVAADLFIDPRVLPPLQESLGDLESLQASCARFIVAVDNGGRVIGSVRGTEVDDCIEVGRLVVDDGWQRRGVGAALMDSLERSYPRAACFRLFTSSDASAPLALYAKRGYRETSREDLGHVILVWLEKRRLSR